MKLKFSMAHQMGQVPNYMISG